MSNFNYQIDSTDKKILDLLLENARTPISLISRKLKISGAAVHQRLKKLADAGCNTGIC